MCSFLSLLKSGMANYASKEIGGWDISAKIIYLLLDRIGSGEETVFFISQI